MGYKGHCIGRLNDVLECVYGHSKPYEFQYGNGEITYHGVLLACYSFPDRTSDIPEIEFLETSGNYGQDKRFCELAMRKYSEAIESGRIKNNLRLVEKRYFVPFAIWKDEPVSIMEHGKIKSFETAKSWIRDLSFRNVSCFIEQRIEEVYE